MFGNDVKHPKPTERPRELSYADSQLSDEELGKAVNRAIPDIDANMLMQLLSEFAGYWFEIRCCKGSVMLPVRFILTYHGDRSLRSAIDNLRCKRCRGKPNTVYFCETAHRDFHYGPPPGKSWKVKG